MAIFCTIIAGEIPGKKVFEADTVMVIMDVNPVSNGHCLVIPKVHYQDLYDIDIKTLNHILKIARDVSKILMEKLSCDGVTLVQNNGSVQEVKHFHLHLIPKYEGKDKVDLSIDDVFHKIVEK